MPKRTNPFQRLVLWIQESLVGFDARVTESAMVYDHQAKIKREVDILIEFTKAGEEYRTAIECRDHKRPADVTWIEQLRPKRDHCGLDMMIAVHAIGFSDAAIKCARSCNIRTYTLKKIPTERPNSSVAMRLFGEPLFARSVLSVDVACPDWPEDQGTPDDPAYLYLADKKMRISVRSVAEELISINPPPNPDIPEGHCSETDGNLPVERGKYFVRCGEKFFEVRGLVVGIRVCKSISLTDSTSRQLMSTDEQEMPIGEIVAHKIPGPGGIYTLGVVVDGKTNKPSLFMNIPSHINPLDFRGELHVTYTEPGSDEKKRVTIPSKLTILDSSGNPVPLFRFKLRVKSIKSDSSDPIEESDILGYFFADQKKQIDLHRLMVEEIRKTEFPEQDLKPGEKKSFGVSMSVQKDPKRPLLMKVRTGDGTRYVNVISIEAEIEYWLDAT